MSRKFALESKQKAKITERLNEICKLRDYDGLASFIKEKFPNWDVTKVLSDLNLGKSINFGFMIDACNLLEGSLDYVLAGKGSPLRRPQKK